MPGGAQASVSHTIILCVALPTLSLVDTEFGITRSLMKSIFKMLT